MTYHNPVSQPVVQSAKKGGLFQWIEDLIFEDVETDERPIGISQLNRKAFINNGTLDGQGVFFSKPNTYQSFQHPGLQNAFAKVSIKNQGEQPAATWLNRL